MSKENVTFRLDSDRRDALDAIAAGLDRDRSYVINEAVTLYLELHQWQNFSECFIAQSDTRIEP